MLGAFILGELVLGQPAITMGSPIESGDITVLLPVDGVTVLTIE